MREIIVNGRFLARRITGVERYGREILSCFGDKCRVEQTRLTGFRGHVWEQCSLPVNRTPGSLLWSPANTGPLLVRDQALTIHDLSPLEHPEYFRKSFATWYRLFLPVLAGRVRVIFTPSHYVRQRVMERLHVRNVIVTPNGVNTDYFSPNARHTHDEFPARYILYVGSLQTRKNVAGLLQAWREISHEYQDLWLVICGEQGPVFAPIDLQAGERVLYVGYIPEEDLPGLYATALLFVLPSLDEGFGLPVLEAMACGTPVIVSNGGALPEVAGNAARIFNTADPGSLAMAIRECLEDRELRSFLTASGLERARQFPWQQSADLIWKTLNEI